MEIKINNVNIEDWNSLINKSALSSPFQTHEYYKFYNSLDGFSADVFAIQENNELLALCVVTIQKEKGIKSYFSRRGIIYGGPIVMEEESKAFDKLLSKIIHYYKSKLIYLEFRNYFDYRSFDNVFQENGFEFIPWLNFHLDIQEINLMKKTMSSSRLRQIKKAIKNGVSWQEAKSEQDINTFYLILKDLYDNKIKKPLFPLTFFTEFYKQGLGKVLLVYFQDKVIGGIVCPIMPDIAIYEYFVCGLDIEYKDQYPSVMATWAAMEYGVQNNIPLFDFMGAGSPDEAYGVREFKSRFGGRQVEHGRYLKILNPFLYQVGKTGLKVLAKTKK